MDQPADISVLFIDDTLLVVNKPAGLATLPDGYNLTLPYIKSVLEVEYGRLWIVHRLDKETSGVLLLARTAEAHRSVNTQFEQHNVVKVYHALVNSCPEWFKYTVDLPLRSNGDRRHRTIIDLQAGKPAVTHFKILEQYHQYCLIEVVPETGRTHQIRAHLSTLGLTIVGDKLYTRRLDSAGQPIVRQTRAEPDILSRLSGFMGLHALSLEVSHPLKGERMKFIAPYPSRLSAALEYLRSLSQIGVDESKISCEKNQADV
jgi:tRNA pseudouridine32 synthase / 23S rRNA pseudouridine746 synthase